MNRTVAKGVVLALASCAIVVAAVPAAWAWDWSHRRCLAPNGTDDTEALQAALEKCSGAHRRCTVTLCAGVFHSAPLRVRDFRGVLSGAGSRRTVLRALPNLEVNDNPNGFFLDDPFDPQLAPWPFLLQLVGGQGTIRDLAVEVPTPEEPGTRPTQGWFGGLIYELAGAVLITGKAPVSFDVSRIRVAAGTDPASDFDTTLLAGVYFEGLLFNPNDTGSYPVLPVEGHYRITDSELEGMISGTPLSELSGAKVTIARNRYRAAFALDVLDASDSQVQIVSNQWDTSSRGLQVLLNLDGEPSHENAFFVYGNHGSTGAFGDGVYFQDPFDPTREPGGTTLNVTGNRLVLGDPSGAAASGVSVFGAGALRVSGNRLDGSADAGIRVDDTTGCWVARNALSSLDTRGGPDVELGSATSECRVVVGPDDVVVDQGTDNRVFRR
jgi:hypothetical protein